MTPNARLLALKDINKGGLFIKEGSTFEVHINFIIGGVVDCVLSNEQVVELTDERLIDPEIRIIGEL